MVTAMVAVFGSDFSAAAAKDLTSGSCELVTGSKSTGPTSPFGVWASDPQRRQRFREVFRSRGLAVGDKPAAAVALSACRACINRVDDGERIDCGGRRGEGCTLRKPCKKGGRAG